MPAGIPVDRRPVPDIAVPVQRLRIARIGDDGVGLRESAQLRVVISRAVVVQPDCSIFPLACKAPGGDGCAAGVARLAPWLVPPGGCALEQLVQLDAAVVGGDVRAAQVVWEQVVGLPAGADKHTCVVLRRATKRPDLPADTNRWNPLMFVRFLRSLTPRWIQTTKKPISYDPHWNKARQ